MAQVQVRSGIVIAHRIIALLDKTTDADDEDKRVAIEIVREVLAHGTPLRLPIEAESSD